jgi:hypothetical protein
LADPVKNIDEFAPPAPRPGGIAARARAAASGNAAYLEGLNPEQREAVESLDGPVLVLAGAGTGKTRVLTTRVAHILATGRAWPSQILSVTFTNRAAREMKERVGGMVGETVEGMPWLGTFHSIGAKILRRHAELVGLKSNFTIQTPTIRSGSSSKFFPPPISTTSAGRRDCSRPISTAGKIAGLSRRKFPRATARILPTGAGANSMPPIRSG